MLISNMRKLLLTRNVVPRQNHLFIFKRIIGTSSNSNTSTTMAPENPVAVPVKRSKKPNIWKSYGFDYIDQREDIFWMHAITFGFVTMIVWGLAFLFSYYPDPNGLDWTYREAYIQIRRREALGLPLVDKNYTDPANVVLPPDDTLGEDDIII